MKNKDNIYILGAGFNQCIKGCGGVNPPLSKNFFSTILKSSRYLDEDYAYKFDSVFRYINKYWKIDLNRLKEDYLDVEECFTFLQLQIIEAIENKDKEVVYNLLKINNLLKIMFIEFLYGFQDYIKYSDTMKEFGKFVYNEKATVITFNYDCNLEKAIKCSTGVCVETPLIYDVFFNKTGNLNRLKNTKSEIDFRILKMHGSLNWFKKIYKENNFQDQLGFKEEVILSSEEWWIKYLDSSKEKYLLDPIIIPPVLYKNYNQKPIKEIWNSSRKKLTECKNLVIIGYSLSFTDFACKKLLLEAFKENKLNKLVVVNPNGNLLLDFKKATHYNMPITVCSNLEEFIENKDSVLG
ncbi:SIR2 family protein [Haloimpatiens sp. FM7315]|uniref:SIR2 family protein n=1 Tax=Haloimpatiens sp. FM7315 TaxID=3298609 RepID=UPI0035A2E015